LMGFFEEAVFDHAWRQSVRSSEVGVFRVLTSPLASKQ